MVNNSSLHYTILKYIIDNGYAPSPDVLARLLNATQDEVVQGLYALQEYHGVVLHPHQPEVWVIHPFSLAPTNFLVKSSGRTWWGNCAWCSLGIAALLQQDVVITTRIAAYDKQINIHIINGLVQEKDLFIHFPVPMKNAWDNVIYTCSNMLVFENEVQVNDWCKRHNIPRGDLQPLALIWEFSKKWYGNHLNTDWTKWTMEEAKQIFAEFGLTSETWALEQSASRF